MDVFNDEESDSGSFQIFQDSSDESLDALASYYSTNLLSESYPDSNNNHLEDNSDQSIHNSVLNNDDASKRSLTCEIKNVDRNSIESIIPQKQEFFTPVYTVARTGNNNLSPNEKIFQSKFYLMASGRKHFRKEIVYIIHKQGILN